jgi:ACS family hexuronate transporter-like MFS transporter
MTATPVTTSAKRGTIHGLRWYIVALICTLTIINYIDRQTLSVLAPTIRAEFGMSNADYSNVVTLFLVGYSISQALSGRLLDKIGTRHGFMLFVGVWTVASMLHSVAAGVVSLMFFRFLLGLGEAGNWPGAAKTVAEWFPVKERAFAMAIFNNGSVLGAVLAPPLIVWVSLHYGWRKTFFVGAGLSAIVMCIWYFFFFTPAEHPRLSAEEAEYIRAGQAESDKGEDTATRRPWKSLFRHRQVWALIAARSFTDPIWWFLITWLPSYLMTARGFTLVRIGMLAWIPFLFGDIGTLVGGAASSLLIRAGWSVDRARKTVLIASIMLVPLGVALVVTSTGDVGVILAISMIAFGFQSWIANVHTLPSDCFAKQDVGSVFGIGGMAAGIASMAFSLVIGRLVDRYSYTPVFLIVAVMGPLAAVLFLAIMGRIERVPPMAAPAVRS